ncbi:FAD/NAD(P)-binding domain-containing protein [Aspergillus aurantiobrunneus]
MLIRPCKVIIAGGGLAGLVLALMLEKLGVDYLLLEARADIVAKAGGGLCMLPNGLRILDQLGCYEDLVARGKHAMDSVDLRDPNGESLVSTGGWEKRCRERYGYPVQWIDRAVLLQIIYGHIADRSKILTQKRVVSITRHEDEVEVATVDGSVFFGDMIVGTDGVHSRVRQEMFRHAEELGVEQEYAVEEKVPATYGCIFGTSSGLPGIPRACLDFRVNRKSSTVLGSGPEDRTYWFFFKNLGRTFHDADIPQFGPNDLAKAAKEHWDERITSDILFSDLFKTRRSAIFTPLREFVYRKWHLDRMMIIGDAAHQMSSIIAQGGNQALESAACLANSLMLAVSVSPAVNRLSAGEIRTVFEQVQEARFLRVSKMLELSHQRQLMDCMETPELEDLMLRKFPKMLPDVMLKRWDEMFWPSVSLHMLPIPEKPKQFYFLDELSQVERARSKSHL